MSTWKEAYDPSWKSGSDSYECNDENLTSLDGAPSHVTGYFYIEGCKLDSLKGAPAHVGAYFYCNSNRLTSLDGAPSYIGGCFYCSFNNLTSLKNIHLQIKHIGRDAYFDSNPIKSHVLGLLLIDGIRNVWLSNKRVEDILNKHLPSTGMESVLEAQDELIMAGLEEFAQL